MDLLDRLVAAYSGAADPANAAPMRKYMRDRYPFLGIQSTRRRELDRTVRAGQPPPTGDDLRAVALACWELPEREYRYFACDHLRRYARVLTPGFLPTARYLIVTDSWWDTVDTLAAHTVGPIVAHHPETVATMDDWIAGDHLWLARTAMLHQLTYKEKTDPDRLFRYARRLAGNPDFFARKAVGWALRQYAWTDPDAVRGFLAAHELSPLSMREAGKNLRR